MTAERATERTAGIDGGNRGGSGATGSLAGAFSMTMVVSGGTVVLSLVTGILTARMLQSEGRGQVAAISAWLVSLSWGSSLGFADAMVYLQSKREASTPSIVITTLVSIPVLGALGVAMSQLLVPLGFSAQTVQTQQLARTFLLATPVVLGLNSMWALLLGQQRFRALNAARLGQPLLYAAGLVLLATSGNFNVTTVLLSQVVSYAVVLLVVGGGLVRSAGGVAWPSASLSMKALRYGLRLQGVAIGQLLTVRLDLLMLPAFVGAAAVGYYSVAVSVASMVSVVFGSLSLVIFPVAARATRDRASDVVEGAVRLTVFGGGAAALALAVLAPVLIPFLYGDRFSESIPALWLLLPGLVLWSAAMVLGGGLQAANRPGMASLVQLATMTVSVFGLLWSIPRYGTTGAAATSSVVYAMAFALSFAGLRSHSGISLRRSASVVAALSDIRSLGALVRARRRTEDLAQVGDNS